MNSAKVSVLRIVSGAPLNSLVYVQDKLVALERVYMVRYINVQLREISCDAVSSRKVPHVCDGRTTAGRCRAVQVAEQPISERLFAVQVACTQLFN